MRPIWIVVFAMLAVASVTSAQEASARIRGVVSDPYGVPVAGARVVLGDSVGNARLATTGKDGAFQIGRLAPGTYSLTVRAGLDTATYDNEDLVLESGRTFQQNVQLKPAPANPDRSIFELPVCFPGFRPMWPSWPAGWKPTVAPSK
jgi:hypothetical protein